MERSSPPRRPTTTTESVGYIDENLKTIMSFVTRQLNGTKSFSNDQQKDLVLMRQALCAPNNSILPKTEKLYDHANTLNQDKASENDKTSQNPPTKDKEDSETAPSADSSNIQSLTNVAGYLPENETTNNPGSSKIEESVVKQRKRTVPLSAEEKDEVYRLASEMTYKQLSKHFNISNSTITKVLKRNDISLYRTKSQRRQFNTFKMHTNGKKVCEITTLLNVSESYVRKTIRRYRSGKGPFPENKTTNNPGSSETKNLL